MAKKLFNTPKGKAIWPRLTGTPDTKFNAKGEWKVKLELSQADGEPIVAAITAVMKESLVEAKAAFVIAKAAYAALKTKSGKKPPTEPKMVDAPYFIDEESGNITLSFKLVASGVNKKTQEAFTQKPVIFDAAGKPVTTDIKIGGGSIIKVGYELNGFATPLGAGASLRLKAVQVITLVEFGADASYYGFDAEEGYAAQDAPASTPAEDMGFTDVDADAATAEPAVGSESDDF
jgi:hypothetical protein